MEGLDIPLNPSLSRYPFFYIPDGNRLKLFHHLSLSLSPPQDPSCLTPSGRAGSLKNQAKVFLSPEVRFRLRTQYYSHFKSSPFFIAGIAGYYILNEGQSPYTIVYCWEIQLFQRRRSPLSSCTSRRREVSIDVRKC